MIPAAIGIDFTEDICPLHFDEVKHFVGLLSHLDIEVTEQKIHRIDEIRSFYLLKLCT